MTDIVIVGTPRTSVNVTLVGRQYRALRPKALVAIDFGNKLKNASGKDGDTLRELETWIGEIFGRHEVEGIMHRLHDKEDDLDLPDIMELIKVLMAKATGNPPTSPSDS